MNIELVNAYIAKQLQIKEADVELVNKFYWNKIHEHFYSYNPRPINVDHLCTFSINKYRLKDRIKYYINCIRKIVRGGTNIKEENKQQVIDSNNKQIKALWAIRKHHKYTN